MGILLTGGSGQLGTAIKKELILQGLKFSSPSSTELDICDQLKVNKFLDELRPTTIINCAAWTDVDGAESNPEGANELNAIGPRNIAISARNFGARLIHISTDYVYGGTSNIPYNESISPDPLSAYGKSKLAGEKNALLHYGSMIIRTSWLYSSFGNNFVKTIIRHGKEKESLRVVFDQTGTPTYAADLAGAIMNIVSGVIRNQFAMNAGIYNYSNEGLCSWYDFATEIIKEAGLECRIEPVLTKDYKLPAPRPAYSVMDKSKIKENYGISIPHWRESLTKCMKLLK